MELKDYFTAQCRASSIALKIPGPSFRKLVTGKKKTELGVVATLTFENFKLDITYFEQGSSAYPQQTIWLSFVPDCDSTLPFSVYDILAFTDPLDFNCYTYTFVDSKELMQDCFGEINKLLSTLVPKLTQMLQNGVDKNRLLTAQKENITRYFGEDILESGEMIGGAADKIINMMIKNFYESQIEAAVFGTQALFYNGKTEKALKKLEKNKKRSKYQDNLLEYIKNGGNAVAITSTAKKASAENGLARHGASKKDFFAIMGMSLFLDVGVSAILFLIFILMCTISLRGNVYVAGFAESAIILPIFAFPLSSALATHLFNHKREKKNQTTGGVQRRFRENFLKYFTITAECIAIFGLITALNSTTVFYEDHFKYSEETFPIFQYELDYTAVDYFSLVEGYEDGEFLEEPHIIVHTKDGEDINLYNSTYICYEDVKNKITPFLKEKNIDITLQKLLEYYNL